MGFNLLRNKKNQPVKNEKDRSPILETDRLILRRQQAADVAFLTDLWSDPEVTRYLGGPREKDWLRSEFEKTAANPFAERYDLWPVIEKETGQPVGHCGLLEKEVDGKTEIELTYIFSPPATGKGYATEIGNAIKKMAFEQMGVRRLIALIDPGNGPSERVAIRLGMRLEKEMIRPGGARRKIYAVEFEERQAS